jgi:hypothetical protein
VQSGVSARVSHKVTDCCLVEPVEHLDHADEAETSEEADGAA